MVSPSIQIAFQICLAFVAGRLIGRWTSRALVARIGVVCVAIAFGVYVWRSGITWHVALIGVALVAGCFSYGQRKYAPRVFP